MAINTFSARARITRLELVPLLLLFLACREAPATALAAVPLALTRIGVVARDASGDLSLDGITDGQEAVPVDPTTLALLDHDLARVVVLDTGGRVIRSFGRHGGGPGEIQNPRVLVRTRSGIGVLDDQKFAVVTFKADGTILPELPWTDVVGTPTGIVTGLAELADGSWLFSTTEVTAGTPREALYRRSRDRTVELASTLPVPSRPVRLACGITLSPAPPVFTPTLRWSAAGMRVAYATTAEGQVTIRDLSGEDSTVAAWPLPAVKATEAAAVASLPRVQASIGTRGCILTPEEALAQRGMARTIPLIEQLTLSPTGDLWARVRAPRGPSAVVFHSVGANGRVVDGIFPALFLTPERFIGTRPGAADPTTVSVWELRPTH